MDHHRCLCGLVGFGAGLFRTLIYGFSSSLGAAKLPKVAKDSQLWPGVDTRIWWRGNAKRWLASAEFAARHDGTYVMFLDLV